MNLDLDFIKIKTPWATFVIVNRIHKIIRIC